jgi:hypothetical protein
MAATNRSKNQAEKKAIAQGVGESKRHGGTPDSPGAGQGKDLSAYTVNGKPLPPECWDTFPISLTDQGKAAMEAERRALPVDYSKRARPAQTIYDQLSDDDKKAEAFRDALTIDTEGLTMSVDPMGPLLEQFTPKGHRGMFMSRRQTSERGLTRGVLTYKPVLVDDGKGGLKEVTCGNMFLASVPEELVRKSDAYYARVNHDKQVSALDKVEEASERLMDRRERGGLLRRKGASDAAIGVEDEDQAAGDSELLRTVQPEPLQHE